MPTYEIKETTFGNQISRTDENGSVWTFFEDLRNPDYQDYLKYLAENPVGDEEQFYHLTIFYGHNKRIDKP